MREFFTKANTLKIKKTEGFDSTRDRLSLISDAITSTNNHTLTFEEESLINVAKSLEAINLYADGQLAFDGGQILTDTNFDDAYHEQLFNAGDADKTYNQNDLSRFELDAHLTNANKGRQRQTIRTSGNRLHLHP